jgi:hypothetical protein
MGVTIVGAAQIGMARTQATKKSEKPTKAAAKRTASKAAKVDQHQKKQKTVCSPRSPHCDAHPNLPTWVGALVEAQDRSGNAPGLWLDFALTISI